LRKDMWEIVADLKSHGTTIILTTHYIEEAEAIADRIGVIAKGELLLVEEKQALMTRMGQKQLQIDLVEPVTDLPAALGAYNLEITDEGNSVLYTYDTRRERTGITALLAALAKEGMIMRDLQTRQSSLEDIFVGLVAEDAA
jgi:ABC-2 type transport system ATP-binding protein